MLSWDVLERVAWRQAYRVIPGNGAVEPSRWGLGCADLVQDALLELFDDGIADYEGSDQPIQFIRRAIRFRMIQTLRSWLHWKWSEEQKYAPMHFSDLIVDALNVSDPWSPSSEDTAVSLAFVQALLDILPDVEAAHVRLWLEGYSARDVGAMYGYSERKASKIIHSGRIKIAAFLEGEDGAESNSVRSESAHGSR
jgi:DNA-directed RNA polymerase specialized sigma24 family protein